jgi:hypothetical protein
MLGVAAGAVFLPAQNSGKQEIRADTVHRQPLPEPFVGWEARFVAVQFPAGVRSLPHRHPGFVLGCVFRGKPNTIPGSRRTPFRAEAEQHSGMIPNTIPG